MHRAPRAPCAAESALRAVGAVGVVGAGDARTGRVVSVGCGVGACRAGLCAGAGARCRRQPDPGVEATDVGAACGGARAPGPGARAGGRGGAQARGRSARLEAAAAATPRGRREPTQVPNSVSSKII